jgi:hypothetical protein
MEVLFIILNNQFNFEFLWRVDGVPTLINLGHGLPRFARKVKHVAVCSASLTVIASEAR